MAMKSLPVLIYMYMNMYMYVHVDNILLWFVIKVFYVYMLQSFRIISVIV